MTFIFPKIRKIKYGREILYNHIVNLDHCTYISFKRESWYPDNVGIPVIFFGGIDVKWYYEDNVDREMAYDKICKLIMMKNTIPYKEVGSAQM